MIRKAGLPKPETDAWVEGFRVDFLWRAQRVADLTEDPDTVIAQLVEALASTRAT